MKVLSEIAWAIVNNDKLGWSKKYDLIFSDHISAKANLSWYDPDTSYESDIYAFMKAFDDKVRDEG